MEQRDPEVGAVVTAPPETVTLPQQELDELRQSNAALRKTVQAQACMFADQQRATPFESAVRAMLQREFNTMTMDLLKKLRADGFFEE